MSAPKKRWCFVKDESSHKYMIPFDKLSQWEDLSDKLDKLEEYSDDWYDVCDTFDEFFSEYRIDGTQYSFTDPQEIK